MSTLAAKSAADRWIARNPVRTGFVIVYGGTVVGWALDLTRPKSWRPGCVAVPVMADGVCCHTSTGGNSREGAETWVSAEGVTTQRQHLVSR